MGIIGFWEILGILAILLFLFGAKKIPLIARGLGEGIRNFRGEMKPGPDEGDEERLPGDRGPERD